MISNLVSLFVCSLKDDNIPIFLEVEHLFEIIVFQIHIQKNREHEQAR